MEAMTNFSSKIYKTYFFSIFWSSLLTNSCYFTNQKTNKLKMVDLFKKAERLFLFLKKLSWAEWLINLLLLFTFLGKERNKSYLAKKFKMADSFKMYPDNLPSYRQSKNLWPKLTKSRTYPLKYYQKFLTPKFIWKCVDKGNTRFNYFFLLIN
jgi:hypothetical protein